jgi:hypothetical protein
MKAKLFALLLIALTLQGQTTTVYGMIVRRNHQPAIRMLVSIARRIAYTDNSGRYRIDGVPVGTQRMQISSGRTELLQTDVVIRGSQQRIDKEIP